MFLDIVEDCLLLLTLCSQRFKMQLGQVKTYRKNFCNFKTNTVRFNYNAVFVSREYGNHDLVRK